MVTIDKDIPVVNQKTKSRYPFFVMDVNDSFFVPLEKSNSVKARASQLNKKTSLKFTASLDTKDGVTGLRVWRVA